MPDSRFFQRAGPFELGSIAAHLGAVLRATDLSAAPIRDIAPLEAAEPDHISVFSDMRYREALRATNAGAIITSQDLATHVTDDRHLVVVGNPRLAYAQVGHLFYPPPVLSAQVDPAARVHPSARIGAGSQVDAGVSIGAGVEIGADCHIAFNSVIGEGVALGDGCRVGANCTITHALIGNRVGIESGVTIGSQGFGFVPGPKGLIRMLQLGRVLIEDDVQIGANCAIDRGATGDTVIGAGTVLDNLVHIGHNVRLGRHCVICGQVGIAGSTVVGDGVMMGGQVGVADHVTIGDRAKLAAKSGVVKSVEPGAAVGGYPAIGLKDWHRQTLGLQKLFRRKAEDTDEL